MAEQTSVGSIRDRIAALNLEEVHAPAPGTRPAYSFDHSIAGKKKPPPPPPPSNRPGAQQRQQTINNPPLYDRVPNSTRQHGNLPNEQTPVAPKAQPPLPPRLPPRNNSNITKEPPSLPPRRPSPTLRRQSSTDSICTVVSSGTAWTDQSAASLASLNDDFYRVRAPAYDPANLPPLPAKEKRPTQKLSATRSIMKSNSNLVNSAKTLPPPQLPSRPTVPKRHESRSPERDQRARPVPPPPAARPTPPPPPSARPSALTMGMNSSTERPPPIPKTRPTDSAPPLSRVPPPIPTGSRPNLSAIMASKPKQSALHSCLRCRDFSAADNHAARYPRQNLPSSDIAWLAHQLTSPFPSATDKARVIFTWLHHNVEYDVKAFFNNNVKRSTPEMTLTSGLAVCEGYAGLFASLALKAGLEAVVIGGNGKGYGHSALKPGDPIPKFDVGHAWNAVRIDNGEWKLLDPCWGAGVVNGPNQPYSKRFDESMFTMDNNDFGWKHFPENSNYFFRTDGRATISWEEYCLDDVPERLQVYGPTTPEHGIGERTFSPAQKQIKVHDPADPMVRFQFATVCPHWDHVKNGKGKPYVMVLHCGGRDGRESDWIPFNTNGNVWWLDIERVKLGTPGQKISVFSVDSIEGRDARGVSIDEYKAKKGRVAMGPFGGVAMWELV